MSARAVDTNASMGYKDPLDQKEATLVINLRALLWAIIILIGGFSVYSQYQNQTAELPDGDAKRVCYNAYGGPVQPEFQAESTTVQVNYVKGSFEFEGDEVVGVAIYAYDDVTNSSACEIFIPIPKQVYGDDAMDTIGHELLHCLIGEFHP